MEARFILNNSFAGLLNEDLYFINDLMLKPKPADIHLHDLEQKFKNLTTRVSQLFLDYNSTKELISFNETKKMLENLSITLKTGIKDLETGNKYQIQTTFTYMSHICWTHIDFSKLLSNSLDKINTPVQSTPEEDKVPENNDEKLAFQPLIILKNTNEGNSTHLSDLEVTPSNQRSSQIEINQNLEKLKNLCANPKFMYRNDSISFVAKIRDENNFSRALGIISDKLGGNYKIDQFMINKLLVKKTVLENDWECKIYLFNTLIQRGDADEYTFSSFIECASKHNNYVEAKNAFKIAKQNPCYLNSYTYFAIITAAIDNNELQDAKLLIE